MDNIGDFLTLGLIIGIAFFGVAILKALWARIKEALETLER